LPAPTSDTDSNISAPPSNAYSQLIGKINQALARQDYGSAIRLVDQFYSQVSRQEFNQAENMLFSAAKNLTEQNKYQASSKLINAYLQYFKHPEAYFILGRNYLELSDYPQSIQYFVESIKTEHRTTKLERTKRLLVDTAKRYQTELSQSGNIWEIQRLYESLFDQFPTDPSIIAEYAKSLMATRNLEKAESLLQTLSYEPGYAAQARQMLEQIQALQSSSIAAAQHSDKPNAIPLQKRGSSYIAKTSINGKTSHLLLDTGASITALSLDAVRRLGLTPTSRSIVLNTANGKYQATLYKADSVAMGKYQVKGMLVAGIELDSNTGFAGLLGTDWLNYFDYQIDGANNALLLTPRQKREKL
jgi:clan AA aspartic protease (TIGR02281 family)